MARPKDPWLSLCEPNLQARVGTWTNFGNAWPDLPLPKPAGRAREQAPLDPCLGLIEYDNLCVINFMKAMWKVLGEIHIVIWCGYKSAVFWGGSQTYALTEIALVLSFTCCFEVFDIDLLLIIRKDKLDNSYVRSYTFSSVIK